MAIQEKIDEARHKIGADKKKKGHSDEKKREVNWGHDRCMEDFLAKEIQVVMLGHLHPPVYALENRYLDKKHEDEHEAGNKPHEYTEVDLADILGTVESQKHGANGEKDIADRRIDKMTEIPRLPLLDISPEETDMQREGNNQRKKKQYYDQ